MRSREKKSLERSLRSLFHQERQAAPTSRQDRQELAEMAVAAVRGAAARDAGVRGLLWAAVRFLPLAFWAVPVAVVALSCALALSGAPAYAAETALTASGPILVAVCLAGVVRARTHLVQELEASCLNNAVAIACVRLAVFGGATLFALALACAACSLVVPAGTAAAYALAPYLVSAAGGLLLARKVASSDALIAAVAWAVGVCALCILLRVVLPEAYEGVALWAWAAAASAGALWCAREVHGWLRLCAQGGIALEKPDRASAFSLVS